jgi:hypothetical protein
MDVSGWSKLGADEIHSYVTKAMPALADELKGADFLNTWGDAIVATFSSAKQAAESALKMRDFFKRALPRDGVSTGLACRVALHQGEVLVCMNALINRRDIFGDAVHVAARLEPVTAAGQVFCTDAFARALAAVSNLAPRATSVGRLKLAKDYGEIEAYVVTWPNDDVSTFEPLAPSAAPSQSTLLDGEDAEAVLLGWLNKLAVGRSGESFRFQHLDEELGLVPGASSRSIERVVEAGGGRWRMAKKTKQVVVLHFDMPGAGVASSPRRGW